MKRLLSFLLALSMAAGLIAGITMTASAEGEDIVSSVELTGMPGVVVSGQDITVPSLQVPSNANYSVSSYWLALDEELNWKVVNSGTFDFREYCLVINVTPNSGYTMSEDVQIMLDGMDIHEYMNIGWRVEDNELVIDKYIEAEPVNGYVGDVELVGNPEGIVAGSAITTPDIQVAEGDVSVLGVRWLDESYNTASGNFEANKVYFLAIDLAPTVEGTALDDWSYIGVQHGYSTDRHCQNDGSAILYLRYSLLPVVESVDIKVTEPKIGAAPADPVVSSNEYSINYFEWYDVNNGEYVVKFEDGHKYQLALSLACADGYEFAEDLVVTINGENSTNYHSDTSFLYVYQSYSFLKQIDQVDITLPAPAIGQTASCDNIKAAAGKGYKISDMYWMQGDVEFTGTFAKAKYTLEMYLEAEEGYEFSEDCKVYINGEETEEFWLDESWGNIYQSYSFRDVITKVDLPEFPDVKVGDSVASGELQVAADARYAAYAQWVKYESEYDITPVEGTVEDNSIYYMMVFLIPDDECEFAEDLTITVGGKTYNSNLKYVSPEDVQIVKMYSYGFEIIDTVELTVAAPENGKLQSQITVPTDANYTLSDASWGVSKTDNVYNTDELEKDVPFAYGNYYWIAGNLQPKEGYVFSDEVKFLVNGEQVEINTDYYYIFADGGTFIYGFGLLSANADQNNPNTGDTVPVAAFAALMVLSVAGLAVTIVSRKKYF